MEDNAFGTEVFLNWLRDPAPEVFQRRHWLAHQQMQFSFLLQRGLHCADRVLDVGCGPMRLGSVLLPFLTHGWYFGQDINPETLRLGETVLQRLGVSAERCTLIASDDFSFAGVEDHSIDLAFSNSLFSHLSLNSILRCLLAVAAKLKPDGRFYATFFLLPSGSDWQQPCRRNKWGVEFFTHPCLDPFHYSEAMLASLAGHAGLRMELDHDFGHPTQTMAVFFGSPHGHAADHPEGAVT